MPELPEVETIRRDLEKAAVGKRIKAVEVTGSRTVRRHRNRREFSDRVVGAKVAAVTRKGKYLLVRLDSGDILVVHFGMSGQLLLQGPKDPPVKHTHVAMTLSSNSVLRFVDPRTFGEVFVTTPGELEQEVPELAHLGFDAMEQVMSWVQFADMLRSRKTKLKPLLMDQRFLAGIGNIYSDEILWAAGLRHDRPSDRLSPNEVRRLYRAMVETLQDAIKHRGSSLSDEQYRDLYGEVGDYQSQHKVFDREGQPCPRCRSAIVRQKLGGRSTFYCPQCQV